VVAVQRRSLTPSKSTILIYIRNETDVFPTSRSDRFSRTKKTLSVFYRRVGVSLSNFIRNSVDVKSLNTSGKLNRQI
jgi:hypothetical protein